MKYAVDYRNMRTAIHGLLLFDTMSKALKNYKKCHRLEWHGDEMTEEEYNATLADVLSDSCGHIEEVHWKNIEAVMKDMNYAANENGRCYTVTSNVRVANLQQSVDLYSM